MGLHHFQYSYCTFGPITYSLRLIHSQWFAVIVHTTLNQRDRMGKIGFLYRHTCPSGHLSRSGQDNIFYAMSRFHAGSSMLRCGCVMHNWFSAIILWEVRGQTRWVFQLAPLILDIYPHCSLLSGLYFCHDVCEYMVARVVFSKFMILHQ